MKKAYRLLQVGLLIAIMMGLVSSAVAPVIRAEAKLQSELEQIAAESPDEMVRVIVQKADVSTSAEGLVEELGGRIIKDLHLINAFAAELPAKAIALLQMNDSVNWVSLDAPVISTGKKNTTTTYTLLDTFSTAAYNNNDGVASWSSDWIEDDLSGVGPVLGDVYIANDELYLHASTDSSGETSSTGTMRDEFNTPSYNNNDGTAQWYTDWVEYDDDGSATSGNVRSDNGYLYLDNKDGGVQESIERAFYLSGVSNPVLTFDYSGFGEGGLDIIVVEVSTDDVTYATLETMEVVGNVSGTKSYDLSPYVGSETKSTIRFRIVQGLAATTQFISFDNIQVEYTYSSVGPQTTPHFAREANLSDGVASATLTVSYRTGPSVDPIGDSVVLEISSDGGASYIPLHDFNSSTYGIPTTISLDILDYASAQTRLRFRIAEGYYEAEEFLSLLSVQIEYEGNSLPQMTYLDTMNVRDVWDMGYTGSGIGVAIIDSGITQDRDFSSLYRQSFSPNSTTVNDVYGHGTHVAGIIGGNGTDSNGTYIGVAPDVTLFGLKISDENGMAYESDTVEALQWVFDHKDQYNIRVVNLSVQSTVMMPYHDSPLDAAAEILWFNGVVVVAASGNYFGDYTFNPVRAAPANDPFIITVGATDEKGTSRVRDDSVANFSAWGATLEGYMKPEIYAPGKDIISVLASSSSWDVEHPDRVVFSGQYFRISGTSMSAPMVTGAAALLLQAEPNLTPDQVKYRLINASGSVSTLPYLDVYKALTTPTTESANEGVIPHMLLAKMAMIAYWSNTECGETCDLENIDWGSVNWNSVNWNSVNWNSVNWNSVNWNSVNWNSVNWNSVNWNSVNWNSVNWNSVNWNSVNWNSVNWNSVNWNE